MKLSRYKQWWRVSFMADGKQQRRFFRSKEEAQEFTQNVGSSTHEFWHGLSLAQRHDLMDAWNLAREGGYTALQAVRGYQRPTQSSQTLSEAFKAFSSYKESQGLRSESQRVLEGRIRGFMDYKGRTTPVSLVSPEDVQSFLSARGWAPATCRSARTDLQTFFNWCVGQSFLSVNPVAKVANPMLEDSPPGILTIDQGRTLLERAAQLDPGLCGFLSVCMFAGIRVSEAEQLEAANISTERRLIEIPGHKAKTRQRRIVTMTDNCAKWIGRGMDYQPGNLKVRMATVRNGMPWPRNCMRHSFASYHLALHGSADQTATQLGHRSTDMLFRHYRELVTPDQGREWFGI